ncbi:MAG: ATP-dependent Clp protease ATP-binding subunit, partial [Elusimicrobiota bacterium]
ELLSGLVHREVLDKKGGHFILAFEDEAQAAAFVHRLAALGKVAALRISPSLMREVDGTNVRQAQAEAEELDDARWQGKVRADAEVGAGDILVTFKSGAPKHAAAWMLKAYGRRMKGLQLDEAAAAARELAGRKWVEHVQVSPAVHDLAAAAPLPEKVVSHGKEHYSTTALLVRFSEEASGVEIHNLLGRLGDARLFRQGPAYVLNAENFDDAVRSVQALLRDESVEIVEVHPNVAAALEGRMVMPYPAAQSYDPSQTLLVQFKSGMTDELVKEYAELRRLRLVYPQFRGKEDLALFEVPKAADAAATRQMLLDETLDEGSTVSEVKPFQEQPGQAELAVSEAAKAGLARRSAAAEAQAEAARNPLRRDPAAEWLAYLGGRKLVDGTTLNDKQVKALAAYLKPLAKNPAEPRPPVVARSEEVKRMLPIVTSPRGMRNSVILVGEAGTGKTAVAEGLAEMIEDAEHAGAQDSQAFLQFQRLKGRWLVELDINKILTAEDPVGTLSAILDLLPRFNDPNPSRGNEVIVLMDEIQKFFLDKDGQKIANVLKGPLREGKLAVIATTTRKEYKEHIEKDDAFRRRLEKIDVEEPTVEQTTTILRALKAYLQKIHDAFIPDDSLVAAAKLADQFDKTNFNPDKAIKAVQDGAELARPDNLRAAITLDVRETWNELVVAVNEARQLLMDKAIASTLALPIGAYNRIAELITKAESLYAEREALQDGKGQVTIDVVKRVIAEKTGIGSGQLNMGEEDAARYNDMEKSVGERVVNQQPALTAIANAIRRNKAGLSNPNRPMGKFLLTGPTGVGKTYLAKELARFLFKDPEAMIRMDMSEYMEEHTVQRLTGSPPGYIGYGEGGQLTEAVRKKPYSVILFDEIEKANTKVFDVLLQILDDGRLTDGEGRTIDFKNTVIIMTSNAGMGTVDGEKYAKMIEAVEQHNDSIELRATNIAEIETAWDKEIDDVVSESLKSRFRPEFLNRLDEDPRSKNKWIRVNRLRRQDMTKIAQLQIKEFKDLLIDRHDTELEIDPSVIDFLTVEGFSPLYGARPMTAAIEKHIVDPMAKWILEEAAQGRKSVRGGLIKIRTEGGKIVFEAFAKPDKKLERAGIEGASRQTAAEVFALIERLVGEGEGEEPSEGLFDKMLRSARPVAPAQGAAKAEGAVTRAFFAPGTALNMPASAKTVAAMHNKAKAADATLRAEIKAVAESVEKAGWDAAAVAAVSAPAGQVGEGWLKQFVAFAKGVAEKAGVAKPLELAGSVSAQVVRLAVSIDAELSDADQAFLAAHFTGTPPAGFEAAQRVVDDLNLHSSIVRNHYLLDLYRRLRDIPGARMGYLSASGRTQIWLEILKVEARPVDAPAAAKVAAADGPATPHPAKEMAKLRALFLRFIDQSRLVHGDQDGIAIRIAAAEAYARLAGPEEAELMRAWINERGWAEKDAPSVKLASESPMAMTAALVLQRL